MQNLEPIRLTSTVKKGGCAAKLPAGELRKALKDLNLPTHPQLLVGTDTLDDACLWDLGNGQLLVQTLDFFTPIVDDPYEFGAIAAANSISDIYAMGGTPQIALTILAFPTSQLDLMLLQPLMKGAVDKIKEAGAVLAGGHTIDDETLKLGFSVTGFVSKNKAWTNSGAKPGDVLILTKGLGTGTITSALKSGVAKPEWIAAAISSMKTLNRAPELLQDIQVSAATDITGFGLAGHAMQVAEASGVSLTIDTQQLPTILGAMDCLKNGVLNRAHKTNAQYVESRIEYSNVAELYRLLSVDAQTSGGLLLSIPADSASTALGILKTQFPDTKIVGMVQEKTEKPVRFI
jgi:selenide, water dikinase